MDIISAARDGDLSALQDAIRSGEDVNSVDEVSWFVVKELLSSGATVDLADEVSI